MGNTGPSFGCTVKQIFNEIFFLHIVTVGRPPTDAQRAGWVEEGGEGGEKEERKAERVRAIGKKKERKKRIRYPDQETRGLAGRWTAWTGLGGRGEGIRIQDSGTRKKQRVRR